MGERKMAGNWEHAESLVCFLTGERSLTKEEAELVLSGVDEELKKQGLRDLPEKTLLELVESKLKEYQLSGRVRVPESAPSLDITENALRVLKKRYLFKDKDGKVIETPEQMFRRVAHTIAEVDRLNYGRSDSFKLEEDFYKMMTSFEFMPNSPTLMNAGRELGQLSACFVLPVGDSLDEIFEAVKHTALIHKSGGGTGFSFSRLRPRNDMVHSTKGVASGPISFMKVFDAATEEIKQGGTRRGANMGILRIDHPDIKDFIRAKDDQQVLRNFNISVALTEEFMKAVQEDRTYQTRSPRSGSPVETLRAREIFDMVVEQAWKNGEPGIIFIDRINRDNPTPAVGEIESTNPCGEQPLLPFESCNLGSINLAKMARDGAVDWDRLAALTRLCVHFLDNVIDANRYPIPQIDAMTKANRKIGLGVMGFADLLIQLGIPYDSEEALKLGEELMSFILDQGRKASAELAMERGPFPNFEFSTYKQRGFKPLRNATITTIAPTGTISIISGCSSGIEPIFAIAYIRNVMDKDELAEVNPYFERVARERGFYSRELMMKIARQGHLQGLTEVPEDVRKVFRTAHEITPEWHIRMQAAFQKYTDNAVSKTVNFPPEARKEDIAKVYLLAYELGCKGVTVYRYGSRSEQVLNIGEVNRKKAEPQAAQLQQAAREHRLEPRPRPEVIAGMTRKMPTGCGTLYVTVNMDERGHLFEVFTNMGKAGGCAASQAEGISRLISLALRAGIKSEEIVKQLKGIRCPMMAWWKGDKILSCADAIAKAIELLPGYQSNGSKTPEVPEPESARLEEEKIETKPNTEAGDEIFDKPPEELKVRKGPNPEPGATIAQCPECGGSVEYKEGCLTCPLCGYTKCL
jgi:ribonucleoside-diphosphate reductase alpha chain